MNHLVQFRCLCSTYNERYAQGENCLIFLYSPFLSSRCLLCAVVSNWTAVRCLENKVKKTTEPQRPQKLKPRPLIFASSNVFLSKVVVPEWITNKFTMSEILKSKVILKWSFNESDLNLQLYMSLKQKAPQSLFGRFQDLSIGAIWLKKSLAGKLSKKVNKYAGLGFGSYRHILNRIASKHSCRTESLM